MVTIDSEVLVEEGGMVTQEILMKGPLPLLRADINIE